MKQKIVIGNWKNYLNVDETLKLATKIINEDIPDNIKLMISPNNLYLNEVNKIMKDSSVEVICQNITSYEASSDTGGITAIGLKSIDINRSIIGHSEVRKRNKQYNHTHIFFDCRAVAASYSLKMINNEVILYL